MDTLDAITQAILTYGPAVVSVVSMVATIVVAIVKIGHATKDSLSEVRDIKSANDDLKVEMAALIQQNAELKKDLEHCLNRIDNVAEVDDGSK